MNNLDTLLQLLLSAAQATNQYTALLLKTRAENRDPSDEEINALVLADDVARAKLDDAIQAAKVD